LRGQTAAGQGLLFRVIHLADTMNVVDPETLGPRLEVVGFTDVRVDADSEIRFHARAG